MKIWDEFKAFAFKGNVIDMAVGVIIGGAFSTIVTSVVNDIIMPAISMLTGNVKFENLKWVLKAANEATGQEEVAVAYGSFIMNVIDFFIIALCIFAFVKFFTSLHTKADEHIKRKKGIAEETPEAKPTTEELLTEIRDMMKNRENK